MPPFRVDAWSLYFDNTFPALKRTVLNPRCILSIYFNKLESQTNVSITSIHKLAYSDNREVLNKIVNSL